MKILYILIIFLAFILPSCKSHVEYLTADKTFVITMPKNLKKIFSSSQACLQCASEDNSAQIAFFSHRTEDLAETADSETLLQIHIDDLSAKTGSFADIESEENYIIEGKNIRRLIYCVNDDNDARNYYIFSSVDFFSNPEIILTSVQIAPADKYNQYEKIFKTVTESAKVN